MSVVTTDQARSSRSVTSAAAIWSAASRLGFWVQRARNRRELVHLLSQPDYMLRDVGLPRGEIAREAMKPFWAE